MEPNHAGEMLPAIRADLVSLQERVTSMHNECIECIRDSDEHVEQKILGLRHDIATLNEELKQESAALKLEFAQQCDDIRAKISQFFSVITRPAAPCPASHLQNRPPPHRCEASASQTESVNRILKRKGNPEVEGIEAGNVSLPQTPANDNVVIFGATNGEWHDFEEEGWRYRGANATGFIVSIPKVCGYEELVEKLCEELGIDRRLHDLELTVSFNEKFPPVRIKKDEDVKWLVSLFGGMDRKAALCVNTKTKNMK